MSSYEFLYDDEIVDAECERNGESLQVTVGEKTFEFRPVGENLYACLINGTRCVVGAVERKGTVYIDIDSVLLEVSEPSEDGFASGAGGGQAVKDKIFAPMPGKIVKIMVEVGDAVEKKQPMVIVEAMKMENQVNALANGTVKAVNFGPGDQVDTETPIIELDLEE